MGEEGCFLWNTTLGWYDFRTFTVLLARHGDRDTFLLTTHHERLHQQLTEHSTYGILLQEAAKKAEASRQAKFLVTTLVDECRKVQEMAATYCSLIAHEQGPDILARMPDFYRQVFERATVLADRFFDTTSLKSLFVFCVARCAMMTGFGEDGGQWMADRRLGEMEFVEELVARGSKLPLLCRPDLRLERIEQRLLDVSPEAVHGVLHDWRIPFLDSPDQEAVARALDGDQRRLSEWSSNLNAAMMAAVSTQLEDALPGLEDNASAMRLHQLARMSMTLDPVGTTVQGLDDIRASADQTVAFVPGPLPRTDVYSGDRRELDRLVEESLAQTGALRYFVECRDEKAEPVCYLTFMARRNGMPNLQCYRLEESEASRLRPRRHPSLTIVESLDIPRLGNRAVPGHIDNALNDDCFIRLATNPVRHLEEIIESGARVEWTSASVAYENSVITPERGLEIVLYRVEGQRQELFHLSNVSLTDAIRRFSALVIGDDRKMTRIDLDAFADRFGMDRIVRLLDHPILGSAHMCGRVARIG
ncbi:hypothetical protein [Streptomyces sp. HUAS TT20]|uniref:hypothetical protein n=1 Tax=Streptomyces sp. HUAS TT20 TaxID=3447509 RepID=UPI0021D845C3|nr:hypothetical protein [Streptomyces sp. HUAS 15-9]UXY32064.1 hypothetical protein N8I87_39615 [Streptomyces sp. HUAS 15-9]